MRLVLQRVSRASVSVAREIIGEIDKGYLVLVAFQSGDGENEMQQMADKVLHLRLFEDQQEKMNLAITDVGGELLVVSQFTLYGDTRRGRRPSFSNSAPAGEAEILYERFVSIVRASGLKVETGKFGAHMQVELINDGPVTMLLDSDKTF